MSTSTAAAAPAVLAAGSSAAPPADPALRAPRRWVPKRVLVTASAAETEHGLGVVRRCEAAGVADIELLRADRLPSLRGADERATYALAKSTLAVVTSAPSSRRLQPVPPSADWRLDLATGCPAHCQYCYLAGSLAGPPVTRVFADLPQVLGAMDEHVGRGRVTSGSAARSGEGTTFEVSCYTDPLGIEHLTGSLAATIAHVGTHSWAGPVGLRFTTKFDDVSPLLDLPHAGRTRVRFSVNSAGPEGAERYEGGTARVRERIGALRRLALAGYPVGLTIAPVVPEPGWQERYGALLDDVAAATADVPDLDLTVEVITHRFTPRSREVLLGWYPRTQLEMDPEQRALKRGKHGSTKHVHRPEVMAQLRTWFQDALAERLPAARLLYFT
ncbi:radical SAM protein [Quadrisphaera sp. DSM 44207]|uniref:SPL family radical SAM protein n=1 Tax=Quadrisphaera sp. DSM 44207 TaxID=1881057 RepID=UPI00088C586F|nr:radical SAM protein [Quadrisphaera sp. DSM 44207]SDQ50439.1 spore photoproduct lyase [Quadrisphaera sp. DSM 44207]